MLRDRARIETAVGMLAARYREDSESARARLLRAAQRASVDPAVVAADLILSHTDEGAALPPRCPHLLPFMRTHCHTAFRAPQSVSSCPGLC